MTQFPRAFVLHQCHGEPLSGAELPNGRVVVFDDPEGWLSTGASSADELLRCGYHGARIEWADQAQPLPTDVRSALREKYAAAIYDRAEQAEAAIERVREALGAAENSDLRTSLGTSPGDVIRAIRAALDQPQQPTSTARHTGQQPTTTELHADVQGRCPACGSGWLILGSGGHVTCPRIGCPNPSAPDDLLNQRAHDWSPEQQSTAEPETVLPTAVLLGTPCDACEHTLNWHRNDVGCIVPRCVCSQFQQPTA
ncbi:hypothetical protein ACFRQM_11975 [Streptomyces sp. NPDC056831]|uniref:hypothetical protein n=1 Tax=Streptomyces sp. NPDC056831 TaxID=3345954 RepID=UPI0036AA96C0